MASSWEQYQIKRTKQIKRRQKFVTIVSLVSFLGSIVFSAAPAIKQAIQPSQKVVVSPDSSLQQRAQGFEMVLKREPENLVALEGLVNVRLKLQDTQGAIQPLEKLVSLRPDKPNYKVILERLRKKQAQNKTQINQQLKHN
ncbi:tetratricopeptide repeat protein [Calothrix membranacea FACHB-236]|nr:tetratricopeptide repeat protein [Calothrix membranacea FACHB-236]